MHCLTAAGVVAVMGLVGFASPALHADEAGDPGHWSFQPIVRPTPPAVDGEAWVRSAVDRFVLAKLETAGVEPSPQADRRTLIRRLHLDLTGLPPNPREVDEFVKDERPSAYERRVDALLASPRFGERWGRHWLDLARYADTDGYEVDGTRPHAWYYRDWVIDAVNRDVPFDRFTVEQLAGDLVGKGQGRRAEGGGARHSGASTTDPSEPLGPWPSALGPSLATAFHRQTLTNNEGGIDKEEYRVKAVFDRVSTTATVWLGLTMQCAQCHDHPYDPMSQREFYQLFAMLNNADEAELAVPESAEAMRRYERRKVEHDERVSALRLEIDALPEDAADERREALEGKLKEQEKKAPDRPVVMVAVMEQRDEPRKTYVFKRGEFLKPITDEAIEPGVIGVLHAFEPRTGSADAQTPDRLDLARWIVDERNPLTPRVTVNRIWQDLFGHGLVRTPDDFGTRGQRPTHPLLLDWLADEFMRQGWSRKRLIRLIVMSATYRQSSNHRPELAQRDPQNMLLHRQNRVRVEAEVVRDLYLSAGGLLSHRIGGPSVYPPIPEDLKKIDFRSDLKWPTSTGEDRYRRGMYTFFKRTLPDPNLMMFDCPDAMATNAKRERSNTPLQALATLNNAVFVEATRELARRVMAAGDDDAARIEHAFALCLSRPATRAQRDRLLRLLDEARAWYEAHPQELRAAGGDPDEAAWRIVASVILNTDAFITRE